MKNCRREKKVSRKGRSRWRLFHICPVVVRVLLHTTAICSIKRQRALFGRAEVFRFGLKLHVFTKNFLRAWTLHPLLRTSQSCVSLIECYTVLESCGCVCAHLLPHWLENASVNTENFFDQKFLDQCISKIKWFLNKLFLSILFLEVLLVRFVIWEKIISDCFRILTTLMIHFKNAIVLQQHRVRRLQAFGYTSGIIAKQQQPCTTLFFSAEQVCKTKFLFKNQV